MSATIVPFDRRRAEKEKRRAAYQLSAPIAAAFVKLHPLLQRAVLDVVCGLADDDRKEVVDLETAYILLRECAEDFVLMEIEEDRAATEATI